MEPTLEGAIALARAATGPLSPHLEAFIAWLIDQRYAVVCVRAKAWRATAFDAWLSKHSIDLADLSESHIDQFARRNYRPRSDCRAKPHRHEAPALRQLLRYLRGQGLCVAATTTSHPADALLAAFEQFLLQDRGLTPATIGYYRSRVPRKSLRQRPR